MYMKKVSLFEPNISKLEKKIVLQSLNENQISSYGYFTTLFEDETKKITNSKYNLATNSGSSALFLALKSVGVKKNEIVLTQSYTFAATTNAIILNNSIPLLLDISLKNLNLDFVHLESFLKDKTYQKNNYTFHKKTNKKISCICLVFTLGIVPDLEKIKSISKKYKLKVIFDAACAFGHKYKNQKLTKYSDMVIYSFNGNKNFTTGGGGLISTDIMKYYKLSKILSNNGKINTYKYKMIGYNLKMSSINAAIGLAQIKRFKEIQNKKKNINKFYNENLNKYKLFNCEYSWGKYMPWMNFCIINNKYKLKKIIFKLKKNNIMTDYFWLPMHKQLTKNNNYLTKYPNTNYIFERILLLPSSTNLNFKIIKKISKIIETI